MSLPSVRGGISIMVPPIIGMSSFYHWALYSCRIPRLCVATFLNILSSNNPNSPTVILGLATAGSITQISKITVGRPRPGGFTFTLALLPSTLHLLQLHRYHWPLSAASRINGSSLRIDIVGYLYPARHNNPEGRFQELSQWTLKLYVSTLEVGLSPLTHSPV